MWGRPTEENSIKLQAQAGITDYKTAVESWRAVNGVAQCLFCASFFRVLLAIKIAPSTPILNGQNSL